MSIIFELRSKIKQFVVGHDKIFGFVFRVIIAYLSLSLINENLGYQKLLLTSWVPLIVSLVCGFLQMNLSVFVIILYTLIHLASFSTTVALTGLLMIFVFYGLCAYFQSRQTYNLALMPLTSALNIPFLMPLWAGLFGSINEAVAVMLGSVLTYFTHIVYANASVLASGETTVWALLGATLASSMFYVNILASLILFLVVYNLRSSRIRNSWIIAVVAGITAELIIMISAYSFIEGKSNIPSLVSTSIITLLIGAAITFFMQELNYAGTERVTFEDDEYFYYVTAVPKIHIAGQEREVKKITRERT